MKELQNDPLKTVKLLLHLEMFNRFLVFRWEFLYHLFTTGLHMFIKTFEFMGGNALQSILSLSFKYFLAPKKNIHVA